MPQKHNSVFISYRRSTSRNFARLIFNDLHANGFDVFLDVKTLASGEFGTIILREISRRAHFVFLVSQSSLHRCVNPADWLRREFDEAVRTDRNIIPIFEEGESIDSVRPLLKGSLGRLPQYNCITIYQEFFEAGLERLRSWLSQPVALALVQPDAAELAAAQERIEAAIAAGAPTENELAAERAFNAAWRTSDRDERMRLFADAIDLDPSHAAAYFERGNIHRDKGNLQPALTDYSHAVDHDEQEPRYRVARGKLLNSLGNASDAQDDFHAAIKLFTVEIESAPNEPYLYVERGKIRNCMGDVAGALIDFDRVIAWPEDKLKAPWEDKPGGEHMYAPVLSALWARALLRFRKGDYSGTVEDCSRIIDLTKGKSDVQEVNTSLAFYLRGAAHGALGNRLRAVRDIHAGSAAGGEAMMPVSSYAMFLAWPLYGKRLETDDPVMSLKSTFDKMADEL